MSKSHLPVIAKAQNQALGEVSILHAERDGVAEHYVAEIYCGPQPLPCSRVMLERLRDDLDSWLKANPL